MTKLLQRVMEISLECQRAGSHSTIRWVFGSPWKVVNDILPGYLEWIQRYSRWPEVLIWTVGCVPLNDVELQVGKWARYAYQQTSLSFNQLALTNCLDFIWSLGILSMNMMAGLSRLFWHSMYLSVTLHANNNLFFFEHEDVK